MLYNLSLVLDEHTEVSHALYDADLKENMEKLEKGYLETSKQNVRNFFILLGFFFDVEILIQYQ